MSNDFNAKLSEQIRIYYLKELAVCRGLQGLQQRKKQNEK